MSPSGFPFRPSCRGITFALLLLAAGHVQATIYTVGTGSGCTHTTLQAAVDAAVAGAPATDLIRVTTGTYSQHEVGTATDVGRVTGTQHATDD